MQKYVEACDGEVRWGLFFKACTHNILYLKRWKQLPLAIIPCSTKCCFLVYGTLSQSGGKASVSLSGELSTGLTLKSYSWWEVASTGGKTDWMGREILFPSDKIFWGHHLAFCKHHSQQHRAGQRPPAFMDEVAIMLSPSPKGIQYLSHRWKPAAVGKKRRGLIRKQTTLWTIYKWQRNPPPLPCTHIELVAAYHNMHLLIASSSPEGMKAYLLVLALKDILPVSL